MSGITQPTAHLKETKGNWILSNTAQELQISLQNSQEGSADKNS